MNNCIFDDNTNDTIGYYKDIVAGLKEQMLESVADNDWEQTKMLADILLDLNGWADNEKLLVLSENNGMGWTIREYK